MHEVQIFGLSPETPGLYLVLRPDLAIMDANDAYLRATLTWREEIAGSPMFDVFPDNPWEASSDGPSRLRASLHRVLHHGRPDRMPLQRYDVRDQVSGEGAWIEKFWLPVNSPVFGSGSREVTHILHEVQDVSQEMFLRRWVEEQSRAAAEQESSLRRLARQLSLRQRALREAKEPLDDALRGRKRSGAIARKLRRKLDAPDYRQYLDAGERAPATGVYAAYHARGCEYEPIRIRVKENARLPPCRTCKARVRYRLTLRI